MGERAALGRGSRPVLFREETRQHCPARLARPPAVPPAWRQPGQEGAVPPPLRPRSPGLTYAPSLHLSRPPGGSLPPRLSPPRWESPVEDKHRRAREADGAGMLVPARPRPPLSSSVPEVSLPSSTSTAGSGGHPRGPSPAPISSFQGASSSEAAAGRGLPCSPPGGGHLPRPEAAPWPAEPRPPERPVLSLSG